MTYQPPHQHDIDSISIYIEGDGFAWSSASTPSLNPTPINPMGLKLARKDTSTAIYVARPCQYVDLAKETQCRQRYWTSHRFSEEVIQSTTEVIDQVKARYGAKSLVLVGYSGGGAVAALVAARRHDVARLITVAGNLDPVYWTTTQRLTPLSGSLNPADQHAALQSIPQTHYIGGEDRTMPAGVANAYLMRFADRSNIQVIYIPGYSHSCCWDSEWPLLPKQ